MRRIMTPRSSLAPRSMTWEGNYDINQIFQVIQGLPIYTQDIENSFLEMACYCTTHMELATLFFRGEGDLGSDEVPLCWEISAFTTPWGKS